MNNNLVVIELDRPRTLKFGSKALKTIEKIFNCKITKLNMDDLGVDDITKILHAGLIHEDSALTLEQLEDLLDRHSTFVEMIQKMTEGFNAAFGVTDPNAQGIAEK